ncbi:MAG: hypothetical protein M3Z03_04515 [Actinomycetota bacterium]|nr:hypothetical protein [Actinomycetota bacterium]
MLDLSTAVLCDFAQVRDRLLFVSSGAVSRLYRSELPSPIGLMVGLIIEVPLEDAGMNHSLRAEVINRHGTVLATLDNVFRVGDEGLFPHEVQQVPLVLSITGVRARTWGTHQIRLYLDDELVRALTLYVVPAAGAQAVRAATPEETLPEPPPPAPVSDAPASDTETEAETPASPASPEGWSPAPAPDAPAEEPAEAPTPAFSFGSLESESDSPAESADDSPPASEEPTGAFAFDTSKPFEDPEPEEGDGEADSGFFAFRNRGDDES